MQAITKRFSVSELKVGMFVLSLDCPMVTTPFPLEGFYIRSLRQIVELTRYCCFVFIDVSKSLALSTLAANLQLAPIATGQALNPNPQPSMRRPLAAKRVCAYSKRRTKKSLCSGGAAVWAAVCVPLMLSLLAYGESSLQLWI